ncbi:hypothetical protein ACRCD5_02905 [Campylobacter taeniopygiae]|uniref:hypothetical protein n=1 Tax=Campylobacter taeniopygiae TaxID=2510188 RepID=UPI003D6AFE8E
MKILLLNENSVVSRLISLSAKKMSYEFEELDTYSDDLGHYDVIVVDSDIPAPLKVLKEKCDKLIFLAPRSQNVDIDAQILYKPFLPTDFLNLLNGENLKIDDTITTTAFENSHDETKKDELDIGDLNLDSHDEISEDEFKIDDLNFDVENSAEENLNLEEIKKENSINEEELENFDDLEEAKDQENSLNEELENFDSLDGEHKALELDENNEEENKEDLQVSQENQDELEFDNNFKLEENIDESHEEEKAPEESNIDDNEILEDHENLDHDEILKEDEFLLQEENLDEESEQANSQEGSFEDELPIVEEQEKEVDFDDIPEDAEFLGQSKEEAEEPEEEILPVIEEEEKSLEENLINDFGNLSAQDQIKEELAQLDELEYEIDEDDSPQILEDFKDKPVFDEKELQIDEEEVVVPNLAVSELDNIKESDIQQALGETIVQEETIKETVLDDQDVKASETANEEIVNELSQSIAGAITSSIKDDTLKAALKGMNMNININVTFNEE